MEYKKQHLPRYIYKYRSCNKNAYNDLFNNFVHLSYPYEFNDPFDCNSFCTYEQAVLLSLINIKNNDKYIPDSDNGVWTPDYIEYVKKQLQMGKSYRNIFIENMMELTGFSKYEVLNYYKDFKQEVDSLVFRQGNEYKHQILLCSFSANVKNNVMWFNYSDDHKGFCIEYDLSSLDKRSMFSHALYPIIYSKKPILSNIKTISYTEATKCMLQVMNKSYDWHYEQEYRLFYAPRSKDYLMPVKPSRIFLGLNIDMKNEEKITKFAKKYNIEVRKMKINASSFSLSHEKVY